MLSDLQGKTNIEEAICLANIIKLNYSLLGYTNYNNYIKLGERCEFIVKRLKIDPNTQWLKEFKDLFAKLKDENETLTDNQIREYIKNKYKDKFDIIDEKYTKKQNNIEFINFALEKYPYPHFEDDKNKNIIDFTNESQELLKFLQNKYHPDKFLLRNVDEKEQLKFCIFEVIVSYLNSLFQNL